MSAHSAAFAHSLALSQETSALAIARRAYQLWEQEGRPEGADLRHWLQAESDIGRELAAAIARAPGAPRLVVDKVPSAGLPVESAKSP